MKKLLGILVLCFLWCNQSIAEEYPNSWKLDIHCKQGKWEWHESAFVVNVENNEFTIGPFKWGSTFLFKGKIENKNIKIIFEYAIKGLEKLKSFNRIYILRSIF